MLAGVLLLPSSITRGQLTHLDSVLAQSVFGTIATLDHGNVNVAGDSSFLPLLRILPAARISSTTTFYVDQLFATIASTDSLNHLQITFHGNLIRPGSQVAEPHSWSFANPVVITPMDREILETNGARYVHLERAPVRSFWDSTLEPALVILGAAAIVALFFLIRS